MIPKGWTPGWAKWKTEARLAAQRARYQFLPEYKRTKEDPTIEIVIVGNGKGRLPTYYVRQRRLDKEGRALTPTLPWRKVVV